MISKFLNRIKDKKIRSRERLEDIALITRFAKKAEEFMDSNPGLSYRFIMQMRRVYGEKFGGYLYKIDRLVSAPVTAYIEKHILTGK